VAKQRRVTDVRSSKKKPADRSRRAVAESTRRASSVATRSVPAPTQPEPSRSPVVVKKPAYYEAIAIYETAP
jgi:hypothetical protein